MFAGTCADQGSFAVGVRRHECRMHCGNAQGVVFKPGQWLAFHVEKRSFFIQGNLDGAAGVENCEVVVLRRYDLAFVEMPKAYFPVFNVSMDEINAVFIFMNDPGFAQWVFFYRSRQVFPAGDIAELQGRP